MKTFNTFRFGLILLFIVTCSLNVTATCTYSNNNISIHEKTDSLNQKENEGDLIYSVVEQMPVFPGGEKGLMKCIVSNIKYPVRSMENKEQGKVIVRFVVNKNGKVEKAEIVRSVSRLLDKEAFRVVNMIPDFIPGKQNGKNVNVYYTVPISFKLGSDNSLHEKADSLKQNVKDENFVYHVIEQMPVFPGGERELMTFISRNLKYPSESFKNKEQGKVVLQFVVNKVGKVEKAEVIRSVSFLLDKEALRVVNMIPDFIPGKQNGKNVNVYYTVPVSFNLNTDNSEPKYLINENKNNRSKSNYHTGF